MIQHATKPLLINNVSYNIDIGCYDLVSYFNSVGLYTKHSCQGDDINNFYIMFNDNINDDAMITFISSYENSYHHSPFTGKFVKWCRKMNGQIISNWMYQNTNVDHANIDLKIFISTMDKSTQ